MQPGDALQAVYRSARILRHRTQLLLDSQQLVVLGDTIRATGGARLYLSRAGGNGEIGNECVFRLARTVRDDRLVTVRFRHLDRLEGFGERADLIELDQNRVRDIRFDSAR